MTFSAAGLATRVERASDTRQTKDTDSQAQNATWLRHQFALGHPGGTRAGENSPRARPSWLLVRSYAFDQWRIEAALLPSLPMVRTVLTAARSTPRHRRSLPSRGEP